MLQNVLLKQTTKYFAKRGDTRLGKIFFWSLLRLCLHEAQVIRALMGFAGQDQVFCFN